MSEESRGYEVWEGQRDEVASRADTAPPLTTPKALSLGLNAEEVHLLLWLCSKAARPGSETFRAVTAMEDRLLAVQADLREEQPAEQAADGLPALPVGIAAEIRARPLREPHTDRELAALEEARLAYAARQSLAGRLETIAERVRLLFSRGGR